jgi:uncharacterized protein YndB with AHSA1/START domain
MIRADGTLVVTGDIAVIAFERRLRQPVDDVWRALADPIERAAWLGPGTLEPRVGGRVAIHTGPDDRAELGPAMSGQVLAWDPPRVLEYEWTQPGVDVSVVRYELEPDGGGTVLRLTHRRSVVSGATGGRAGWHAYLDRLAAHLDGLRIPSWVERRAEVEEAYREPPLGNARRTSLDS